MTIAVQTLHASRVGKSRRNQTANTGNYLFLPRTNCAGINRVFSESVFFVGSEKGKKEAVGCD